MKTAIQLSNPTHVPGLSAVLLVIAALLAVAAWSLLEINKIPYDQSPAGAQKELRTSTSTGRHATYQARRHPAVSLGTAPAAARVTERRSGGINAKRAVL